ncbi:patatin-like phospholipase family protein [Marinoscillum sp. MHG1-6]|uniref:patatin-like phospholipase family protein n=1 Tax=Marinoscillum sp. MHG1-6 TaxID=2959627 RepID=UPI002158A0BF|nr:patatin-like phospholipase family protein [Marinoscillum sp. MHG1-6]
MSTSSKVNLFENIALAFSGGGFRAASFCLGVLSYLNHFKWKDKTLLHHVAGLSTVSGGTIAGAAYAKSAAAQQPFDAFFKDMKSFLNGDEVLIEALDKLENEDVWANTDKKHTLVNAFSIAYADSLTDETFGFLKKNPSHLQDICFNATEFSFGLAFRFQLGGDFGNYRIDLNRFEAARDSIKIADAVASSSCFPLGFAPMIMPDDYLDHDHPEYQEIKKLEYFKDGIGLMDGGIVDNQGIGSTMLANNRRKNGQKYDLVVVCDVASYNMSPWEQSDDVINEGKTIKQIAQKILSSIKGNWIGWIVLLVGLGLTWVAAADIYPDFNVLGYYIGGIITFVGVLAILARLVLGIGLRLAVWFLKKWVEKLIPKFFLQKVKFFDDLKIELMKRMIEERVTSGVKMVSEVFLKQIRRLNYDLFYRNNELKKRRATVLIYQLTKDQFEGNKSTETRGEKPIPGVPLPSPEIYKCAQTASEMATTLWFTPEDIEVKRLENLIACGQFTICYSLIRYLTGIKASDTNSTQDEIDNLKAALVADWTEFVSNPFWLLDD